MPANNSESAPLFAAVDKLFRYMPGYTGSVVPELVNAFLLPKKFTYAVCGEETPLLRVFRKFRSSHYLPKMNHFTTYRHLEVVEWLLAHCPEQLDKNVMDWTARSGHLDVVKWLHEDPSRGCTEDAMDSAAENGHLDVVQWLHENRTEGCTEGAMDLATGYGHLDVVKWLHENRTEGCTQEKAIE